MAFILIVYSIDCRKLKIIYLVLECYISVENETESKIQNRYSV